MFKHYPTWSKPASRAALEESLGCGEVCITSSDTVLGFLAGLTSEAFEKLDRLKQRSNKPYLLLIGDKNRLPYFVETPLSPGLEHMVTKCWPGPVTLIFKAKESLPSFIKGPEGTVALRVPQHEGLLSILKDVPGLFSTSANLHGKPIPETVEDIDPQILLSVAYVVVDDQGKEKNAKLPSTILDCTGDQIRVVRSGAYPIHELEALYGQPFL